MLPLRDTIPSRHTPWVTWGLIVLTSLVFLASWGLPPRDLQRLFYLCGIVPARFTHPEWAVWVGLPADSFWPFVSSVFLHGGWLHLIGNMWTLWIFGDNVEDRMGPWRFLAFYLFAGIAAGVTHWITNLGSTVPTVGASGAIAGVLGAYFRLFPRSRVVTLIPIFFYPLIIDLPAVIFLIFWFFAQLFSGTLALLGPSQVGGVAWWAHVGGFLTGLFLFPIFLSAQRQREARVVVEWPSRPGWP